MPEISRTRFKIIGHRIDGNKVTHFTAPETAPDAAGPATASAAGAPEIVAGARIGVIPDDSIVEVVTRYSVVTLGNPPASTVTAEPAP